MKTNNNQTGFTVVELLISLFIASAFLLSGYQLFNVAVKDSGDTRIQTLASDSAYEYLQRYKSSAQNPCTPLTPFDGSVTVQGLLNPSVTVSITCPYASVLTLSKATSTIQFGSPAQTISISTYVKP